MTINICTFTFLIEKFIFCWKNLKNLIYTTTFVFLCVCVCVCVCIYIYYIYILSGVYMGMISDVKLRKATVC